MDQSRPWHRHIHLTNGLAGAAATYPPALVGPVLQGLKEQMQADGHLSSVEAYTAGPVAEEVLISKELEEEFWDTVNGG